MTGRANHAAHTDGIAITWPIPNQSSGAPVGTIT